MEALSVLFIVSFSLIGIGAGTYLCRSYCIQRTTMKSSASHENLTVISEDENPVSLNENGMN